MLSGSPLVRTPDREFVCLYGPVSSSPRYHFSWASTYKSGQCEGDHVVIERWPKTKGIYSIRFDGGPVPHVTVDNWDRRFSFRLAGPCEMIRPDRLNELPEENQVN